MQVRAWEKVSRRWVARASVAVAVAATVRVAAPAPNRVWGGGNSNAAGKEGAREVVG